MTSSSATALLALATLLPGLVAGDSLAQKADHRAITRLRTISSSYYWTITNYSMYSHSPGDTFVSPKIFTHEGETKLNWSLVLYPHGQSADNASDDSVAVYLIYNDGDLENVRVSYHIHILDKDEGDFRKIKFEQVVKRGFGVGSSRLAGTDEIDDPKNNVLHNDELRIYVHFVAFVGDRSYSKDCSPGAFEHQSYIPHLEAYLGNFDYSDLVISVEDSEFRAHRLILASRSRVFDEIFKSYGTARGTIRYIMEDFKAKTVAEALKYMYSGRIGPVSAEEAAEMLAMTYKYVINGMEDQILEQLCLGLQLHPEEKARVMEQMNYDAIEYARRVPADAQKTCTIVPIDLSKVQLLGLE